MRNLFYKFSVSFNLRSYLNLKCEKLKLNCLIY